MERQGVLVISHGSRDATWVERVDRAVHAMDLPETIPVESAFLELVEGRLIQDGIDRLEAQGVTQIAVIPLFISSGSTHIDEISWAFGVIPEPTLETDLDRFRIRANIRFGSPVDDDPVIARILHDNLMELSTDPAREALLLVGHGSKEEGFYDKWRDGLVRLASRVRETGGYAAAETAMLLPDQIQDAMERLCRRFDESAVLVAPLFLSEGYFTRTVLPNRLQPYRCRYNGRTLLPSPYLTAWMERQAAELLRI